MFKRKKQQHKFWASKIKLYMYGVTTLFHIFKIDLYHSTLMHIDLIPMQCS